MKTTITGLRNIRYHGSRHCKRDKENLKSKQHS